MKGLTRIGFVLALFGASALGVNARSQAADDKSNDKNASKTETIRGVIAGVTVEGETAIDFASHRAETVAASFLTVVGSPARDMANAADRNRNDNDKNSNQSGERRRHNVYVIWLTPQTLYRDATNATNLNKSATRNDNADKNTGANASTQGDVTTMDKIEVGDHVEVTFDRREYSRSNGGANDARANRHGRHRTYFGNATSVTILSMPSHDGNHNSRSDQDKSRDDDKDKTKNPNR
jgi:hypothetical protein